MSFSGNTDNFPAPEQKTFGLDERRMATNEQARPVPYFAGRRLLGVTYLSDLYSVIALPKIVSTKKDDVVAGYHYYASFAAMVCHGPVDKLYSIYLDQELVWSGDVSRNGDSEEITIPGRGTIRIYWGTETQPNDLVLALAGEDHPPYRGQCYINASLYFGYQRTQAPNIELEVGRWPVIPWLTAAANVNGDCNPIAFIAELAMNQRFGAGLPQSRLDTGILNSIANTLANEGMGLSPLLNRQTNFRELLIEALQYFDGYHYRTPAGKFAIGLNRPISGTVPVIGLSDLLDVPQVKPNAWETTINDLRVKFTNRTNVFKEDSVPYINRANRQIVGKPNPKTIDRSWITDPNLASKVANASGRQLGLPETTGSISVKKTKVANLHAGELFHLCYPPTKLSLTCRIQEKTIPSPAKPRAEIQFKVDRGYLNTDDFYISGPEPPPPPPTYTPDPIKYQKILELPYGLRENAYRENIGILAARPTQITTGLHVHKRKASGSYDETLARANYAQHGRLREEYPATTALIDDERGLLVRFDSVDKTLPNFPLDDALTNDWLLYVNNEILSILNATLVSTDTYRIYSIRGRYDTIRQRHQISSEVFVIRRTAQSAYDEIGQDNPQTYKLQPFVLGVGLDLSKATPISKTLEYRGLRPWSPKNLRAFGENRNPTFSPGQNIPLTWNNVTPDPTRADVPTTLMEIYQPVGGILTHSEEIASGFESRTILNSELVTWFGGEQGFTVRLYHIRPGNWKSLRYEELTIQLV